jgi:hypothetical protein
MNTKERDAVFQHWRSVILRETRDLASLERVGARALQDREVRADATLESLIQGELAGRRAEIERDQQSEESANRQSRPAVRRSDYVGRRTTAPASREPRPESGSAPPPPVPLPPAPAQAAFDRLAQTLSGWLMRGDEDEARAVYEQMRVLQEESCGVIPAGALPPYEDKVAKLRTRLGQFRVQIAALVQQAIAASQNGDEQAAATLMRRLAAIHVTYPRLLDEARLEDIRAEIVHANEEHDDGLTARQLVERERAVTAEIRKIAGAVHEFHRVVCEVPDSSAEFRSAEAAYLRTLQEVRAHDPEWLAGFVLELANLLAEWRIPSRVVGKQIDRFLESVRLSMKRIHAEMGQIDAKQDEAEGS